MPPARPSDGQLAILQVLWARGPSTVRQVHEALSASRDTGYTTTLKLMQIMAGKGLVGRDASAKTHVYTALVSRDRVQRQLLSDLVDRAFGGSAAALVMQALSLEGAPADEIAEIERQISAYEGARKETT